MFTSKLFRIFLLTLLISFSANTNTTHAQINTDTGNQYSESLEAELYVGEIFFDRTSYEPGDIVNGAFQLHNTGEKASTNVRYGIELVELYDLNGFDMPAQPINVSEKSIPFNVEKGLQGVNFTYNIPSNIPDGKTGILVQMYTSEGIPSAMSYVPIEINGARQMFFKQYPVIVVGDDAPYDTQAGPTVEKDEDVFLVVGLQNTETKDLELLGEVSLYKGPSIDNNSISKETTEKLVIKSKVLDSIQYQVPVKNLEPGVYTLIFQLKDMTGQNRGIPIESRFIVAGLMPKINNVSYNTSDFTNKEKFIVSVEYTDTPLNFRTNKEGKSIDPRAVVLDSGVDNATGALLEGMSVEILITDTVTGQTISSQEKEFSSSNRVDVEFDSITNTESIRIDTTLKQNNEKIDVDSFNLKVKTSETVKESDEILLYYVAGGIALLLLILIPIFVVRRNKKTKVQISNTMLIIIALAISGSSVTAAFFLGDVKTAEAVINSGGIALYETVIHSPKPPAVKKYKPGENMMFLAQNSWANCNNKGPASVDGQASTPVKYGQAHTGMSGLNSVLNDPDAVRKVPVSTCSALGQRMSGMIDDFGDPRRDGCKTVWLNLPPEPYRTRYGIFARPFIAPMEAGTYWFNYRLGVRAAKGVLYTTGTVVFEVADTSRDDICTDIAGIQIQVPVGYIQSIGKNGQLVCPLGESIPISCSVSSTLIEIGQSVTYTASTQQAATFKWYNGNSVLSRLIKTDLNKTSSNLIESYNAPGIYKKTITAQNSNGKGQCTLGVTVRDPRSGLEDVDSGGGGGALFFDEDGNAYSLDPDAGDGVISFDLEGSVTNDVCKAKWSSQNTLGCWLYKNNESFQKLELSGSMDLQPGKYKIMCLQSRDGAKIYSAEKICLKNPDLREI